MNTPVPDPNHFLQFWLTIALIASVVMNLGIFFASIRRQRREVRFEFEPASKETLEKRIRESDHIHRDLFSRIGNAERGLSGAAEAIRREMHDMEIRINASSEERSSHLHERINQVLGEVREVKGQLQKR
jgi:hypothetical protein